MWCFERGLQHELEHNIKESGITDGQLLIHEEKTLNDDLQKFKLGWANRTLEDIFKISLALKLQMDAIKGSHQMCNCPRS